MTTEQKLPIKDFLEIYNTCCGELKEFTKESKSGSDIINKLFIEFNRIKYCSIEEKIVREHILKSDEYSKYFYALCRKIIITDIYSINPEHITKKINEHIENETKLLKNKLQHPTTSEEIDTAIRESISFQSRYKIIIKYLYTNIYKDKHKTDTFPELPQQTEKTIMSLIQEKKKNHNMHLIFKIVYENVEDLGNYDNSAKIRIIDPLAHKWQNIYGRSITNYELENIILAISDSGSLTNMMMNNIDLNNNLCMEKLVKIYKKIFNREITIREYLKYAYIFHECLLDISIKQQIDHEKFESDTIIEDFTEHIQELYNLQKSSYQIIRQLYLEYIGVQLTEHEFIDTYINTIENPEYYTIIQTKLTDTDIYREQMQLIVSKRFHALYDKTIDVDDLKYIFDIIHKGQLTLDDDTIQDIVTQIKDQTDTNEKEIVQIYKKILQREPDINEYTRYKHLYREEADPSKSDNQKQKQNQKAEDQVYTELYDSLEYHDILKEIIREQYQIIFKKKILPSQLFGILSGIKDNDELRKHKAGIHKFIETYEK
jgi:hypothetical protein